MAHDSSWEVSTHHKQYYLMPSLSPVASRPYKTKLTQQNTYSNTGTTGS